MAVLKINSESNGSLAIQVNKQRDLAAARSLRLFLRLFHVNVDR